MQSLVTVGLFVGFGFVLAVGFLSVARDLHMRLARLSLSNSDERDEATEEFPALTGDPRFPPRGSL